MKTNRVVATCTLLLCLSFHASLKAQAKQNTQADTTLANKQYNRARALANEAKFDSAIVILKKASLIYRQAKDWEKFANSYNNIGEYFRKTDQYDSAEVNLRKALATGKAKFGERHAVVATSYTNLGILEHVRGNFDKSLEYVNKSLAICRQIFGEKHTLVAASYLHLGLLHATKGDFDKAFASYDRALSIFQQIYGENHSWVGGCYNNMGIAYEGKGDYANALAYHRHALSIRRKLWGEDDIEVAQSYSNIGHTLAEMGNYSGAIDASRHAADIYSRKFGEKHSAVVFVYATIGENYGKEGDYRQAFAFLRKALAIGLELWDEFHPTIAAIYSNIASTYVRAGNYGPAIEQFQKSLSIYKRLFGEKHLDVATCYYNIGDAYTSMGDPGAALENYQKSIVASARNFESEDVYQNPALENITSDRTLLKSLVAKADALNALSKLNADPKKDIEMSLSTYMLALRLVGKIRSGYKAETSKLSLAEETSNICDKAIQASLRLFHLTGDQKYKEKVFSLAENSKSAILLDALSESRAKTFAGLPDSLLAKEHDLKIDLAFVDTQIQKEEQKSRQDQDSLRVREFRDRFFTLKRRHEALIGLFEREYPKYYELKYKRRLPSLQELQKKLDHETVFIEYFIGDSSSVVLTATSKAFDVIELPKDSAFTQLVSNFCNSLSEFETKAFPTYSRQLYKALIQPIEANIAAEKKLIIVPAGILSRVPFEALLADAEQGSGLTPPRSYLVNRFEISYDYSGALFLQALNRNPESRPDSFIGFAPVFSDSAQNGELPRPQFVSSQPFIVMPNDARSYLFTRDGAKLDELKYTKGEVEAIRSLFAKRELKSAAYVYAAASEENFKTQAGDYKYVHVATHGFINNENPKLSNLAFSQPRDSLYHEDGILYAAETFNLRLNADLVALSACKTGVGKLYRGEGMLALSRGFLYSGAKNLLVSLWQVDDQRTSELMLNFYRNVLAHESYAKSLRAAKLEMLRNPDSAFPGYWSVFVLIGG